jgi:hypothetical protein
MIDIDSMTPREMVAALMRGDRIDMRLGYTAESAVLATVEFGTDVAELLAYARGFADGMADAIESKDRATRFERNGLPDPHVGPKAVAAYMDGLSEGRLETAFTLYPSLPVKEKA